ncbi:MAG: hypothetical protein BZ151_08855 [Desulfobacca sp. 4484_104]|nr:MAG: hypothetical protein BZ151_08855 [Desulfobacca sp. 4484_104]
MATVPATIVKTNNQKLNHILLSMISGTSQGHQSNFIFTGNDQRRQPLFWRIVLSGPAPGVLIPFSVEILNLINVLSHEFVAFE